MDEIKAMTGELISRYNLLISFVKALKKAKNENDMEQILKLIDSIEVVKDE
jgi:hypothetical protein